MARSPHRNYHNTFNNQIKWHRELRVEVYKRDLFICKECGKMPLCIPINYDGRFTIGNLCVDHVTPAVAGGNLSINNCQTLCESCNGKKGSKQPFITERVERVV